MLTSFWSGLGSELAKHWAARILTPAFVFWTGGAALVWWSTHHDEVEARGWSAALRSTGDAVAVLPAVVQVLLLLGTLLLLAASGLVADRLTLPLLRLLEGYWTRPALLRRRLVTRRRKLRERWSVRVDELRKRQERGSLSYPELREMRGLEDRDTLNDRQRARLEELKQRAGGFSASDAADLARGVRLLRNTPRGDHFGMPTRLGDILRAAEQRPQEKYGLDAIVCWYRLWLVMPAETRSELAEVRLGIDSALRTCLWAALFAVWAPWLWWIAVPVAVVIPFAVYLFSILPAAALFGDLVDTAFDLHRMQLYDAMHLPRPQSAATEHGRGQQLTRLLWHGETDSKIIYVASST